MWYLPLILALELDWNLSNPPTLASQVLRLEAAAISTVLRPHFSFSLFSLRKVQEAQFPFVCCPARALPFVVHTWLALTLTVFLF